jgi:hypothetical protein
VSPALYSFFYTIKNGSEALDNIPAVLSVIDAPVITYSPTPASTTTAGLSFDSGAASVTGGKPPFLFTGFDLASGLALDSTTGRISGTAALSSSGSNEFQQVVTVTDVYGATSTTTLPLIVVADFTLECCSNVLSTATDNASYTSSFSITGGLAPFTVGLAEGQLPSGLVLSVGTSTVTLAGDLFGNTVSGGPNVTFSGIRIQANDSVGNSFTTPAFEILVAAALEVSGGLPSLTQLDANSTAVSEIFTVIGGFGEALFSAATALPTGLALVSKRAVLIARVGMRGSHCTTILPIPVEISHGL